MVDNVEDAYPLEPGKYSSQALYIARQIKANETLVERIEEAMGKEDALRVRRLQRRIEALESEYERRDRDSLIVRQLAQLQEECHRTRGVGYEARRLLEQEPVPLDELRRLLGELKSPRADLLVLPPFPSEAPR